MTCGDQPSGGNRPKADSDRKMRDLKRCTVARCVEVRRTRLTTPLSDDKTAVDHYDRVRDSSPPLPPASQAGVVVFAEVAKGRRPL